MEGKAAMISRILEDAEKKASEMRAAAEAEAKKVMLRLGVRLWTPKTNRVLMAGVTRRKEHS